ncbi:gastrokine-2-like [Leptodactylus fuscus]|uniref:gastrokine-2-like n=1 Tax=Leptodactylus fuscus TaxID=238119 RepID=UPI003F4EFA13
MSEQTMKNLPVPLSRRRWIEGIALAVLLVGIILAVTLIGIYMSQKHTEKMVTLVFNSRDGQKVQQMISVNEQENMAAFFVHSRNESVTVLYDYRRDIIGIRKMNSSVCYVLRMDRSQIPTIHDILRQMDYFRTHNISDDSKITYRIVPQEAANPPDVGMSVNLLCSDVAIYWAQLVSPEDGKQSKWSINIKIKFYIKF